MKKRLLFYSLCMLFFSLKAQFTSTKHTLINNIPSKIYSLPGLSKRSSTKPNKCETDTVLFTRQNATAFNTVTISQGRSLGQFYSTPQSITLHGFTLFAFAITPTPVRAVKIKVRCNIYKAGLDSLPTGNPIASDTLEVDTVSGASITLTRIQRLAKFKTPLTIDYPYVVVVDCDSSALNVAIVTSSWQNKDGQKRNLGCGSISNIWYRCLSLNIAGVPFDANMQLYPHVKYTLGTDFKVTNPCNGIADTVRFENNRLKNVSSSPFYNFYNYANFEQYCHLWSYNQSWNEYVLQGKYKYPNPSNEKVRLITRVSQWATGDFCYDTAYQDIAFKPSNPLLTNPNSTICKGDSIKLEVVKNDNFSKVYWVDAVNFIPYDSGYSKTFKNMQKSDSIYIQKVNKNCKSSIHRRDIIVNSPPTYATVLNDSICNGAIANLTVQTDAKQIIWFADSVKNSKILNINVSKLTIGPLTADSSVYVGVLNLGCPFFGGLKKVSALVGSQFAPQLPIVSPDTWVCFPHNTIKLTAIGSDNLNWYSSTTGGSPLFTGSEYTINPTNKGTYTYYVENDNGVCGSGRVAINVYLQKALQLPKIANKNTCENTAVTLSQTVPYGNINWYETTTDKEPYYVGKDLTVLITNTNKTYYYKHSDLNCEYANFESTTITAKKAPVPTTISAKNTCYGTAANFNVVVPSGTVQWFKNISDTTPFKVGAKVDIPELITLEKVYYTTKEFGCQSNKEKLELSPLPNPVAGFSYSILWQNRVRFTAVNTTNADFKWDFGNGQTSTQVSPLHAYSQPGIYNVKQIATHLTNGCKDSVLIPVNVSHLGTKNFALKSLFYPNPIKTNAVLYNALAKGYWQIFDLNGKLLQQSKGILKDTGFQITVPPGLYFIKVQTSNGIISDKLLVTE